MRMTLRTWENWLVAPIGCVQLRGHVTLVHHTGKDDTKGARGHSLLRAAVDTEIAVWRSKEAERAIGVSVTKQRDLDAGRGFAFKLETKVVGKDRRGKATTSCVVKT